MESEDDANQAADMSTKPHEQTADVHMKTYREPELEKSDLSKTNCIGTDHADSRVPSHIEEEMIVVPPYGENMQENILPFVSFGGNTEEMIEVPPFGANMQKLTVEIRKNLRVVTQEMHRVLHRLLLMFAVAYEQLDGTMAGDLVYDGIEETFFTPVWGDLIALFRSEFALAYIN